MSPMLAARQAEISDREIIAAGRPAMIVSMRERVETAFEESPERI
jgi:hypothetical protein